MIDLDFAARRSNAPAAFLFLRCVMCGLLKSVIDLTVDGANVVTAPVQAVVDLADAAVKPFAEIAKDLSD
jgi:hypothetical protein